MPQAIIIEQTGGPEVLQYTDIPMPQPGPGEVLIEQKAAGLNFIDVYFRTGLYNTALPFIPGVDGAGVVIALGEGVTGFAEGERIAYASRPLGSYSTHRTMPANRIVKLPDHIDFDTAAGCMTKGMTAEYLLNRTYPVQPGETILFHAAAGGVGLIACQWAKALGATIIGTVGTEEKAELARAHGCDHTILYNEENIVERVMEITEGKGVPVVYDSVGQATFEASLDCLQKRGTMVSFGNASGPVEPIAPGLLAAKGSLFLTRPTMNDYADDDQEYQASAAALFDLISKGKLDIPIRQTYALKDAAQAHKDLESRKTTGSSVFEI